MKRYLDHYPTSTDSIITVNIEKESTSASYNTDSDRHDSKSLISLNKKPPKKLSSSHHVKLR